MPLCAVRGSVNCDEYFNVKAIGRPGETISSFGYTKGVGGKGANQAVAVARAARGAAGDVHFIGAVGADGQWIRAQLAVWGVDVAQLADTGDAPPTGRALIQVAEDGENAILLFPGANFDESYEDRAPSPGSYLPAGTTHLLLQNEITLRSTHAALASAKADPSAPVTTVFNPSPMPSHEQLAAFPWHQIDWLVINEGEGQVLYSHLHGTQAPGSVDALLTALTTLPKFDKINIICTLGGSGLAACVLGGGGRRLVRLPAAKVQDIRDTTGAGDTFTGYFVRGLMELEEAKVAAEGAALEQALRRAIQAAGMCVEKRGTVDSIPHREDVESRLSSSQ
ncbi:Ribokinase-like protein [Schizophyllum fasciatum]